jgi:tetratricopeptide (TPR) repeat protein
MKKEPIDLEQSSYSSEQIFEQVNQLILQLEQNCSETKTEINQEEPYQLHLEVAKTMTRFGYYKKALFNVEKAIGLQPGRPQVWIFKGHLLLYLKRYEAALTSFQQAIKIQPNHQAALFFSSVALYHLGQQKEAYLMYQQALAVGQQPIWKKLTQIFKFNLYSCDESL